MSRTNLLLSLGLATVGLLGGCGTNGGGGDDDPVGPGDPGGSRPPVTDDGVSTLAGWTNAGFMDGDRQKNLFNNPVNAIFGPDGKVYVADFDNSKVRVVDLNGNATTLIAKTGFARPFGLAFVGNTLYVSTDRDPQGNGGASDMMSGTVWKVDIDAKTATPVATRIGRPRALCALSDGRLAVGDYEHHVVQILDPASGNISPLAGQWVLAGFADGLGAAAQFSIPYACAQRNDGKIVFTDQGNHRLRLVGMDGTVASLAGNGTAGFADGAMAGAKFNHPQGITKDSSGDFYITDIDNYRVRKISADFSTITTIAGNGMPGSKDSTDPLAASFYGLEGLSVKADGSAIIVADGTRGEAVEHNSIRIIKQ
jgi:sugar lactone lactonase YvrE